MKLYPRIRRQLLAAVRRAWREHGSVRVAAAELGMPKSTFHDLLSKRKGSR